MFGSKQFWEKYVTYIWLDALHKQIAYIYLYIHMYIPLHSPRQTYRIYIIYIIQITYTIYLTCIIHIIVTKTVKKSQKINIIK